MSIYDKKGLVSKEIAVLHRWESEIQRFAIKQVGKGHISTVKRQRSWSFERSPFIVTFRLDYEVDVSSVRPSSSFSD